MKTAFLYYILLVPVIVLSVHAGTPPISPSDTLDSTTLTFIRNGFYKSVESHSKTNKMIEFIESNYSEKYIYDEPVLLAYYGALNALKAKHVFNPFAKISYLRTGLRTLDEAAIEGACNLEVRFLRFSILHNIPAFLGLRDTLQQDTDAVYELLVVDGKYSELDTDMAFNVIEFVIDSKRLNEEQQKEMELLVNLLERDEQLSSY